MEESDNAYDGAVVRGRVCNDASAGMLGAMGSYISSLATPWFSGGSTATAHATPTNAAEGASVREVVRFVAFDELYKRTVLLIGYNDGFQIWGLEDGNEGEVLMCEICSVRKDVPIKSLKTLPIPDVIANVNEKLREALGGVDQEHKDIFSGKRPLVAVLSAEDRPQFPRTMVKFYSLHTQNYVNQIKFTAEVYSVKASPRFVLVILQGKIYGFKSTTLEKVISLTTYPSPVDDGVCALGSRWVAFPSSNAIAGARINDTDVNSVDSKVDAESFGFQLASGIYDTIAVYMNDAEEKKYALEAQPFSEAAGSVCVIDGASNSEVVAFKAHSQAISYMSFDPSGILLLTASVGGHAFHIFQIFPGKHTFLYKLRRGMTPAVVQSCAFSHDSKMVAISTRNGTTHLFPLRPTGGQITIRSHPPDSSAEQRLVNDTAGEFYKDQNDPSNQKGVLNIDPLTRIHNDGTVDPLLKYPPVACFFPSLKDRTLQRTVLVIGSSGIMFLNHLKFSGRSHIEGADPMEIMMTASKSLEYDLCRRLGGPEFKRQIPPKSFSHPSGAVAPPHYEAHLQRKKSEAAWLAHAELQTHSLHRKPLFQVFHFKTLNPDNEAHKKSRENLMMNSVITPTTNFQNATEVQIRIAPPVPVNCVTDMDYPANLKTNSSEERSNKTNNEGHKQRNENTANPFLDAINSPLSATERQPQLHSKLSSHFSDAVVDVERKEKEEEEEEDLEHTMYNNRKNYGGRSGIIVDLNDVDNNNLHDIAGRRSDPNGIVIENIEVSPPKSVKISDSDLFEDAFNS